MGFQSPANGLPANVKVGDTVIFDIRQTKDGMYQITSISPTADAPKSSPPAKAMSDTMDMPSSSTGAKK
jgi:Cu(I)/Ag(I) efflux system membrane fusion protein